MHACHPFSSTAGALVQGMLHCRARSTIVLMKPQRKFSRLHLTWEYALQRGARGCRATQAPGSRPALERPLALGFDAGNPGAV